MAAGAGLQPWQVAALNARTEILAAAQTGGGSECSTAVLLPAGSGPPRTVQTWDWLAHLRDVRLMWMFRPRPDVVVRTFTEFGVVGKIGVNSRGLGIHFNILQHTADGEPIGVPVHVVARRILDEASTIEEATRIASSARVSASTAITVVTYADGKSRACALELSPVGLAEIPLKSGEALVHTNHFLDRALAEGERLGPVDPDTYRRRDVLATRIDQLRTDDLTARAHAMLCHREDGACLCCHPDRTQPPHLQWETLLTLSLDLARCRLRYHEDGPCAVRDGGWSVF